MKTIVRISIFAFPALTLSVACARSNTNRADAAQDGANVSSDAGDGHVVGSGGTTRVPETAGVGGRGGILGNVGGAFGGSARDTGGAAGATWTQDAGTSSGNGGSGHGGTAPPATGRGGATGGNGLGGTPTGGLAGTGGDIAAGTSGSTGAGGSVPSGPTVHLDRTQQTMRGFGINNNWAPAMTDAEADALFDPSKGIGLSILRIGMGSDGGFMNSASPSDIKKAKARGVDTFIGTVWSPPASYKTNNSENGGGHLLPQSYETWADTIAAFAAKVKESAGVELYAMSPQSEPDYLYCPQGSCSSNYPGTLFTAEEMVAFVKVVGPRLRALSPPVRVLAPETSEWLHLWSNETAPGGSDPLLGQGYDYGHALYQDTEAWAQVDILGTHQYDTQTAHPWPSDVPQTKPIWVTEMAGVRGWPEGGPSSDIDNGLAVAGWIHDAIVNGPASAWLWWWLKAYSSDTNEGLYLNNGTDTKRHYTLGNFSRFIRPGYTRVAITGNIPTDVMLSAYQGGDGTIVVVAINKGSASANVPMSISGGDAPASLQPWLTSASDNLAAKTAVTVSGGSFTAVLASKTVTTFVGK